MPYRFYKPAVLDFIQSFVDQVEEPQLRAAYGMKCEGSPCGPNGCRGRNRGHRYHGGQHWHHQQQPGSNSTVKPQVDIYSTETNYKVFVALPSADKESIELTYDPNTRDLTFSGNLLRPAEFADLDEEGLKKVLQKGERQYGRFEGKEKIPTNGDGDRIRFEEAAAKFENGVLELTLPKVEKEEPKPIVID